MPFERKRHRVFVGCAAAVVGVAVTFAANRYVTAPFLVFFPAVFGAAWWGNRIGGWIALVGAALGTTLLMEGDVRRTAFVLAIFVPTGILLLHAVSRLHDAVRSRELVVQVVSHDLKAPLTSILLQEQILARRARDGAVESALLAEHAQKVEKQLQQILSLITNVLDTAEVSARRLELRRARVDLAEIATTVVDRFRPLLEAGGYELSIEGAEPGRLVGSWDRVRIEQVLSNLVSNAIKYGEGKPIRLRFEPLESSVRLHVIDGGKGMRPEELRTLFGRFERGDATQGSSGHGLGLWIVRTLVEAHGGRVEVESEHGRGSTFLVELPR